MTWMEGSQGKNLGGDKEKSSNVVVKRSGHKRKEKKGLAGERKKRDGGKKEKLHIQTQLTKIR